MGKRMQRDVVKESYWQNVIRVWREAGLTRRVYSEQHGVILTTIDCLCQEVARCDQEVAVATTVSLQHVPMTLSGISKTFACPVGGWAIASPRQR